MNQAFCAESKTWGRPFSDCYVAWSLYTYNAKHETGCIEQVFDLLRHNKYFTFYVVIYIVVTLF